MPTRLHQLLAVEDNLKGQAEKTTGEIVALFRSKRHHFEAKTVTFKSYAETEPAKVEQQSSIQTSVNKEIDWISRHIAKAIDGSYQVDLANTHARADVVTEDGTVLVKDVPTTALLRLGHRLNSIKEMIEAIPTLDPAKGFEADASMGIGYYKARPVTKERTKKDKKVLTLATSTDKHPAQAIAYDADVPTGTIEELEWSTLITPAKKADLLDNVEILIRAVKAARAKANDHEIETDDTRIGATLLEFVFQPLKIAT